MDRCPAVRVSGFIPAECPAVSGLPADLRWSRVDPGCVHAGGAREPSGLGDVRLRLLLRHDFHLDGGVRLRGASQQRQLGGSSESCSCLSDSCGLCGCTGIQVCYLQQL